MSIRNALSLSSLLALAPLALGAGCANTDAPAGDSGAEEEDTASAASALGAEVIDQESGPYQGGMSDISSGNMTLAQVITAGKTGLMTRVQLNVGACFQAWGISCWFTLRVRTVTAAGLPGTAITTARAFIPESTGAQGYRAWVDVVFDNPAAVVAGTRYTLEVIADPGSNVQWSVTSGYAFPGGFYERSNWGETWYGWAPQWNAIFTTWVTPTDFSAPLGDWGYGDRRWAVDFNGDGLTDYCRAVGNGGGAGSYLACSLSTGSGLSGEYTVFAPLGDWGYSDRRWMVDFNGDGKADYCRAVGNGGGAGSYLACSLSTGTGLSGEYTVFAPLSDWGYGGRRWMADFNGDGKADYCRAVGNGSGPGSYLACSFSTGTGLSAEYSFLAPVGDWGYDDRRWMVDFNGDGRADYCRAVGNGGGAGSYLACSLSTGAGLSGEYTVFAPLADWGYSDRRWMVDFDGNGMVDYCRSVGDGSQLACSLSNGGGLGGEYQVMKTVNDWGPSGARWMADFTGDRHADLARASSSLASTFTVTSF
jgi:hypothetical protein